jgi:hypothetical protein
MLIRMMREPSGSARWTCGTYRYIPRNIGAPRHSLHHFEAMSSPHELDVRTTSPVFVCIQLFSWFFVCCRARVVWCALGRFLSSILAFCVRHFFASSAALAGCYPATLLAFSLGTRFCCKLLALGGLFAHAPGTNTEALCSTACLRRTPLTLNDWWRIVL